MNATQLRKENGRLKEHLAQAEAQHEAAAQQFADAIEEKQRQVTSLEYQIKLLLQPHSRISARTDRSRPVAALLARRTPGDRRAT